MRAGGAEVALQLFAGGLAEVDGDEAIDGIGEGRIDVEGGEFAAEFQVVFDEDGDDKLRSNSSNLKLSATST